MMNNPVIIAIDGPAASGKSTVARGVAAILGFDYLDTGSLYRVATWFMLQDNIPIENSDAVCNFSEQIPELFSLLKVDSKNDLLTYEGQDLQNEIRNIHVTKQVSAVSAYPCVRKQLQAWQRNWAACTNGCVLDGRDIGTVVFPQTPYKFYVDAQPEIRAERRSLQNGQSKEDVLADIHARDTYDASRTHDPLQKARDAILVDTTELSVEESIGAIVKMLPHHIDKEKL